MSVSIKYKGTEIASASTETTKTIKTAGKYCEADIIVENTPDGGDAPVINPLSVTANGTYTAPSGVDGYSPITVNVPQGITPTGNINITDTNVTDVTNYATATVVSENLTAENIKKNVNILGIVGSFEGSGGGLPNVRKFSVITNPTDGTYGSASFPITTSGRVIYMIVGFDYTSANRCIRTQFVEIFNGEKILGVGIRYDETALGISSEVSGESLILSGIDRIRLTPTQTLDVYEVVL